MAKLTDGTTHNEISGFLANLEIGKLYNIQDLVDTVLQINNLKQKTLDKLKKCDPFDSHVDTEYLKDLWVSMTYQRKIRLKLIFNKLKSQGGFNKDAAGHVDIAIRSEKAGDKKVVWDGFRRCLKAGICGLDQIPVSKVKHSIHLTQQECEQKEAKLFKIRNADHERMSAEEIFKARIVYGDPTAIQMLDLMKECFLSVEGLNPNGIELGGIGIFESNFTDIPHEHFITSSQILREAFPLEQTIGGYLFVSLAYLLKLNENVDSSWDEETILEKFKYWIKTQDKNKQKDITKDGFRVPELIAYLIASRILKDEDGLIEKCKETISNDRLEMSEMV